MITGVLAACCGAFAVLSFEVSAVMMGSPKAPRPLAVLVNV
jgi:hypothetical protein